MHRPRVKQMQLRKDPFKLESKGSTTPSLLKLVLGSRAGCREMEGVQKVLRNRSFLMVKLVLLSQVGKGNQILEQFFPILFLLWQKDFRVGDVEAEDSITSIKRRHRDQSSNGVRIVATASGCGRLKEDLESSTWRRRQECWTGLHEMAMAAFELQYIGILSK
ncbi:hypothetical protein Tco_1209382 [Tanacetum coccineum]